MSESRRVSQLAVSGMEPEPHMEWRTVWGHLLQPQGEPLCSNRVCTAKYKTWVVFPPIFLFRWLQKLGNCYFVVIAILQSIPSISPLSPVTAILPLIFVFTVSACREFLEDLRRHQEDARINGQECLVRRGRKWKLASWQSLEPGDVVAVRNNESVPADLVILDSSKAEAYSSIQTASLDGETNLKGRQGLPELKNCFTSALAAEKRGEDVFFDLKVEADNPRHSLDVFDAVATLKVHGKPEKFALSIKNFLPRESVLKSTEWVHGLVVFCGKETKVMLGQSLAVHKVSQIDSIISKLILGIICLQVTMCLVGAFLGGAYHSANQSESVWYQGAFLDTSPLKTGMQSFFSVFLLLNTMIPISLLVTIEIVKVLQTAFVQYDREMHYNMEVGQGEFQNISALCRTSTLNEDLGQVGYIFSDKTGTLTSNMLELNAVTIGNSRYHIVPLPSSLKRQDSAYLSNPSHSESTARKGGSTLEALLEEFKATEPPPLEGPAGGIWKSHQDLCRDFVRLLALCHDVTPEWNQKVLASAAAKKDSSGPLPSPNTRVLNRSKSSMERAKLFERLELLNVNPKGVEYAGESPDECCLVDSARKLGSTLLARSKTKMILGEDGHLLTCNLLYFLPFSNARKRSTVILQTPADVDAEQVRVYCKGADDVMLPLVKRHPASRQFLDKTERNIDFYSSLGLRTLVCAMRVLPRQMYDAWKLRVEEAEVIMNVEEREKRIASLYEEIEMNFVLVGCTATEDKLQVGVPEAIEKLRLAEIHVWMITGDKLETAIEIAKSCRLFSEISNRVIVDAASLKDSVALLKTAEEQVELGLLDSLVISGRSLEHLLDESPVEVSDRLARVFLPCRSVVCCRATKSQKAQLVVLMQKFIEPGVLTLAVGDGANDVAMIKKAHVGVGIFGKEGRQAVQNSDYAIAQFAFLERLLLFHGRLFYIRISKLVLYFFYKNIMFTLPQYLYQFWTQFSGGSFYDDYYITCYNLFFTGLAPFLLGTVILDVSPDDDLQDLREEDAKGGRLISAQFLRTLYPKLYIKGLRNELFNARMLVKAGVASIVSALVCFFLSWGPFLDRTTISSVGSGTTIWYPSLICYSSAFIVAIVSLVYISDSLGMLMRVFMGFSVYLYLSWFLSYDFAPRAKVYGSAYELMGTSFFFFTLALTAATPLFAVVGLWSWKNRFSVSLKNVWQLARLSEGSSPLSGMGVKVLGPTYSGRWVNRSYSHSDEPGAFGEGVAQMPVDAEGGVDDVLFSKKQDWRGEDWGEWRGNNNPSPQKKEERSRNLSEVQIEVNSQAGSLEEDVGREISREIVSAGGSKVSPSPGKMKPVVEVGTGKGKGKGKGRDDRYNDYGNRGGSPESSYRKNRSEMTLKEEEV